MDKKKLNPLIIIIGIILWAVYRVYPERETGGAFEYFIFIWGGSLLIGFGIANYSNTKIFYKLLITILFGVMALGLWFLLFFRI